jgi:probable phosphoglycerate mutase
MPGGEGFRDFHQRVVSGLEASLADKGLKEAGTDPRLWAISEHDTDYRIVLVAHGGTNAVVLGHLLGMAPTPWEWDRLELPHTGVARIVSLPIAHAHAFSLRVFADTTHLEAEMVTK